MLKMKFFQVALLVVGALGLGLVPADAAMAGSCKSDRPSHDRWHDRSVNDHRQSHDRWHGSSQGRYDTRYESNRYDSYRDRSSSRVNASYRNDNVRFSVSIGSGRSYDDYRPVYRKAEPCRETVVIHQPPSGYWKQVYCPPVYETRYDSCGRPYRVCVRAGYYDRVWVSTRSCR